MTWKVKNKLLLLSFIVALPCPLFADPPTIQYHINQQSDCAGEEDPMKKICEMMVEVNININIESLKKRKYDVMVTLKHVPFTLGSTSSHESYQIAQLPYFLSLSEKNKKFQSFWKKFRSLIQSKEFLKHLSQSLDLFNFGVDKDPSGTVYHLLLGTVTYNESDIKLSSSGSFLPNTPHIETIQWQYGFQIDQKVQASFQSLPQKHLNSINNYITANYK